MENESVRVLPTVFEIDEEQRAAGKDSSKRFAAFKNQKARAGPELVLKGLSIANYRRNPVLQWAHSHDVPIGRVNKLTKTTDSLLVEDFDFLQDDPMATRVENAWNQGMIRASSIAWAPIESEALEEEGFFKGFRDTKSDLLEISLVPVPADPDALRAAFMRALNEKAVEDDPFDLAYLIRQSMRDMKTMDTAALKAAIEPVVLEIVEAHIHTLSMASDGANSPPDDQKTVAVDLSSVKEAVDEIAGLMRQQIN